MNTRKAHQHGVTATPHAEPLGDADEQKALYARSNPGPTPVAQGAVASGRGLTAASGPQRLVFVVPGDPVPKARPRLGVRGNTYTPRRTAEAEQRIVQYLKVAYPNLSMLRVDCALRIDCYIRGQGRGDWDNFGKLVSDALNRIAYEDDSLIQDARVRLFHYSDSPRTEVTLEAIQP